MSQQDHVVVVGAGPVGILNALGLARAGLRVTVLERGAEIGTAPRAMVYHYTVLQGLADLGILEQAEQAGFTKQDYAFWFRNIDETLRYSLAPLEGLARYPYNLHLGQDRLAQIGLAELQQLPGVEIRFNWALESVRQDVTSVTVISATGEEVTGDWLVGADGAGSAVRKALGLGFDGITWDQRFVATDIRYDFAALGFARTTMVVDPDIGAIVAQVDDSGSTGVWRYTFSEERALPEEGVHERALERLRTALPDGGSAELIRFSPYRMHQRSAPTMRVGRVVLAGDAGHATNPTGGLGLTSGLLDTYALYPTLAAVVGGDEPDSVLDTYSTERLRVFRDFASPMAIANKQLVFDCDDPEQLRADCERMREQIEDPDQLMARLRFTESLMTEPLTARSSA